MTKLTRRSAIAGLVSTVSCPAIAGLQLQPDFDVLIVGAGAAGIAAARRIAASGRTFAILEASDRRGGRCFTDMSTFDQPYDQCAYSIHPKRAGLSKNARSGAETTGRCGLIRLAGGAPVARCRTKAILA
ncbi:MAG: FAD-dependent oxidoreductase [Xanthobacteraceae bacterium]